MVAPNRLAMLELDGSAGGGQLLRTALALSAVSGRSFEMRGIRSERPSPGLRPQHLAAVRAVGAVTDASVDGADEGSKTLQFRPGRVRPGHYAIDVGTAGSLTLLFDALLPLTHALDGTIALTASGGTDVRWAPTMDHYRRVKLPLLRRHGVPVAVDVTRRGFYPAGGGEATLVLAGSSVEPLALDAPEGRAAARGYALASEDRAGRDVAERQADAARGGLAAEGVEVTDRVVEYAGTQSTGSAVAVRLERGDSLAGGDALGERGTPAEEVGQAAVDRVVATRDSGAAVDVHLADQLLVFLALAGGRLSVPGLTEHAKTNLGVLEAFGHDLQAAEEHGRYVLTAEKSDP